MGGKTFYLNKPNDEQKLISSEIYRDVRNEAVLEGVLTEAELFSILNLYGIWTVKDEEEKSNLEKALEDLKVNLFEKRLQSNAKLSIRTALRKTKDELNRLESVKHSLDYLTVDGLAMSAKYRYLIASCLSCDDDSFIDYVVDILSNERLNESQFRELARTEPWRSIWGARSVAGQGVFNAAATDLTDDQRNMLLWSTIFDSIREYPDCPGEDIFEDDDMLDGWMIIQRRKREAQQAKQRIDSIGESGNPKVREKLRNAQELFFMADTIDDAKEIEKGNDAAAQMTKEQRMAFLKQKGEVKEAEMPDTLRRIQMETNRLEAERLRHGH